MKAIVTIFIGMIVFFPCLFVCNESASILPNLGGLLYVLILCIALRTKVGKMALYRLEKACTEVERMLKI